MVLPSAKYAQYERDCGRFLTILRGGRFPTIDYPVNIRCLFYMPNKRLCDLTNLEEAIDDVLVKYGIIADDNYKIVAGHDGSRVFVDKENPRTEILIQPIVEV